MKTTPNHFLVAAVMAAEAAAVPRAEAVQAARQSEFKLQIADIVAAWPTLVMNVSAEAGTSITKGV